MDNKEFGRLISSLRKEKGWTQLELANKLNVTDKAVSKWERGRGFPDLKMIEPLAEIFDVSIIEIMRSEKEVESKTILGKNRGHNHMVDVSVCKTRKQMKDILILSIMVSFFCFAIWNLVDYKGQFLNIFILVLSTIIISTISLGDCEKKSVNIKN